MPFNADEIPTDISGITNPNSPFNAAEDNSDIEIPDFNINEDEDEDIYNVSPRNKGKEKAITKNPRINTITKNKSPKEPPYKSAKENALNYTLRPSDTYIIKNNLFTIKLALIDYNIDRQVILTCTLYN
jgi:hypothetical protein